MPEGLQKGGEGVFPINSSGPAKARNPQAALLETHLHRGSSPAIRCPLYQCGQRAAKGTTGAEPHPGNQALRLSERVSSPNYMNSQQAALTSPSSGGNEEGPHPQTASGRPRLIGAGQQAERAQLPRKGLLVLSELARSHNASWKERGSYFSLGF